VFLAKSTPDVLGSFQVAQGEFDSIGVDLVIQGQIS
jgi:hypothetical protein